MDWCYFAWHPIWHNVWLGVLMSRHEEIIVNFMLENPNWKRFQFRKELNKVFTDDPFEILNYIPDGFYIDVKNNTVNILEVDGTSGTTKGKLNKMIDLWWQIDGRSWFLNLTSISVYTEAKSIMIDSDFSTKALQNITEAISQERKQNGNVYA